MALPSALARPDLLTFCQPDKSARGLLKTHMALKHRRLGITPDPEGAGMIKYL